MKKVANKVSSKKVIAILTLVEKCLDNSHSFWVLNNILSGLLIQKKIQ